MGGSIVQAASISNVFAQDSDNKIGQDKSVGSFHSEASLPWAEGSPKLVRIENCSDQKTDFL